MLRNGYRCETSPRPKLMNENNRTSTTLYSHPVPDSLLSRLPDLYHTHHTTANVIRLCQNITEFDAIAVHEGDQLVHLIGFVRYKNTIRLLCPHIRISGSELDGIAEFLFDSFPKVIKIHVPPVRIDPDTVQVIHADCGCFDTFEVKLPDTFAQYQTQLCKHFMRTLKQHLNRLNRKYPDARFQIFQQGEITEDAVHKVVAMNHERMRQLNKLSSIDDQEEFRVFQLARRQGFLAALLIDDQIVSGVVGYNSGQTCHIEINACDMAYSHLGPGIINCYRTAEYAITQGAKTLCLGPGDYRYKRDFGGCPQIATEMILFRSRFHAFCSLESRFKRAVNAWERSLLKMKFRLKKYQRFRLFVNKLLCVWRRS